MEIRLRQIRHPQQLLKASMAKMRFRRRLEHLLGQCLDSQANFQPRNRSATRRTSASKPLPEPLRADTQRPDGQKHKTLPSLNGKIKQPNLRKRRTRQLFVFRYYSSNLQFTRRLLSFRIRIQKESKYNLDNETYKQVVGKRDFFGQ